jgi:putative methyltransferase (TIGR04325 family)
MNWRLLGGARRWGRHATASLEANFYPDPLPVPAEVPPDPAWRVVGHAWPKDAAPAWNSPRIAEEFVAGWEAFTGRLRSPAPLGPGLDGGNVDDLPGHNLVVSFAYALALAAQRKRRLSMLDWGGGVGHFGVIARAVLPEVEIRYLCVDLPELCERGRQLDSQATFVSDDSWTRRRFDFSLASGSLQCIEDWRPVLASLARATDGYLLVTRLPVVSRAASFVVAQRHYDVELPCWVLNRDEFLAAAAEAGLRIRREFFVLEAMGIAGASERFRWRGFLFST